jgi:ribosome maturation factor RimP
VNPTQVSELLTDVLAAHGLELEAVEIAPSGKRTRVRIVVDGDGPDGRGPGLDDIGDATRAVSAALDESPVTGDAPYTLEVTSRGVSRPLTLPRHWRRNRGRLVEVQRTAQPAVTGRIGDSTETTVTLDVAGSELVMALSDVTQAVVQVEFARKNRATPADIDTPADIESVHGLGSED